MRASDADREATARSLREHFAAGRLTEAELDERVTAAYAAREDAELVALTRDLPALPMTAPERSRALAERRADLRRRVLRESGSGLTAFLICVVVWTMTSPGGYFWPIWVALAVVAPLVRGGLRLYGPGADLDALERDLERRRQLDDARDEIRRREVEAQLSRRRGAGRRRA